VAGRADGFEVELGPAATAARQVELCRFANHHVVGLDAVEHVLERRAFEVLFQHRRGHDDPALELCLVHPAGRGDHRGERPLHVGRAPAVQPAVLDLAAEGVVFPGHAGRDADGVAVGVKEQRRDRALRR
jgi:hypothetical protein